MTPDTPAIDIAAIRARAEKATRGIWCAFAPVDGSFEIVDDQERVICSRNQWPQNARESHDNAMFIVHAKHDIPALCDALTAERERSAALAAEIDKLGKALRSAVPLSSSLETIPPDETDLRLCSTCELPTCPLCSGTPVTTNSYRADTAVYRSIVHCSRCDVQVGYNARTKDEARAAAMERWSKRPHLTALTTSQSELAAARVRIGELEGRILEMDKGEDVSREWVRGDLLDDLQARIADLESQLSARKEVAAAAVAFDQTESDDDRDELIYAVRALTAYERANGEKAE